MSGILLTETAVFRERKFFFHFLLVALGVMSDAATSATLELGHVVFDGSHSLPKL